jgi:flavorubredoxin
LNKKERLKMSTELYNDGEHKCIAFYDLDGGAQSNQFLIIDGNHAAFLNPGGDVLYKELLMSSQRYISTKSLDYIITAIQSPDILCHFQKWLVGNHCKIVIPALWERFIIHNETENDIRNHFILIPDSGMTLKLGNAKLKAIPAHFLRAVGNFQFYDPISKIFFSGEMGASLFLRYSEKVDQPIEDFEAHIHNIEAFHRRWMVNHKICQYWVNMIRELDIEWLVPQYGRPFKGKAMIENFLKWVEELECGTDLVTQENYKVP